MADNKMALTEAIALIKKLRLAEALTSSEEHDGLTAGDIVETTYDKVIGELESLNSKGMVELPDALHVKASFKQSDKDRQLILAIGVKVSYVIEDVFDLAWVAALQDTIDTFAMCGDVSIDSVDVEMITDPMEIKPAFKQDEKGPRVVNC